jgi:L-alanine-DL-glutamate epimerase-like enolase superfamily enzyme
VWSLDARVAKSIRGFEIGVDVFDLPNLLDHQWGVSRATAVNEAVSVVSVAGWDAAAQRPLYDVKQLPARNAAVPGSAWRIQIGARQSF